MGLACGPYSSSPIYRCATNKLISLARNTFCQVFSPAKGWMTSAGFSLHAIFSMRVFPKRHDLWRRQWQPHGVQEWALGQFIPCSGMFRQASPCRNGIQLWETKLPRSQDYPCRAPCIRLAPTWPSRVCPSMREMLSPVDQQPKIWQLMPRCYAYKMCLLSP